MKKLGLLLAFAFVTVTDQALSAKDVEEIPAKVISQSPPSYPRACELEAGASVEPVYVVAMYDVTDDGRTENIRVRETASPCFNDAVVSAVRRWRFDPRRVKGSRRAQEDLETRFTFLLTEETQTTTFDARPLVRVPPRYPERCAGRAKSFEAVTVSFDVAENGRTENVKTIDTTNRCLNRAATSAVRRWRYAPKMIDGQAMRRNGVETFITFELLDDDNPAWRMRVAVKRELNRVRQDLSKSSDFNQAAVRLKLLEEQYGADFSKPEMAEFYFVRAMTEMGLREYRRALDDLKRVQSIGISNKKSAKLIEETILKLEIAISLEGAK